MEYLLAWLCPPLGYLAAGMWGRAFRSTLWLLLILIAGMGFPPLWLLVVWLQISTYVTIGREKGKRRDERLAEMIASKSRA